MPWHSAFTVRGVSSSSWSTAMTTDRIDAQVSVHRRRFLGTTAAAWALLPAGLVGSAQAQTATSSDVDAAARAAAPVDMGPLHQIDAGDLTVGYAEFGPKTGPAVLLLHGWPYDIHSYADVAPRLAH